MILRNQLPDEADELMKQRWQIINVCILFPQDSPHSAGYSSFTHLSMLCRLFDYRYGAPLKQSTRTPWQ